MDTKLKNNKKNYLVSIIAIIILIIASMGIVSTYPAIEKGAKERYESPYENYSLLRSLYRSNYVLYKDVVEKSEKQAIDSDKIFIKSYSGDNKEYEYIKERLNYQLENYEIELKRYSKNLEYYAIDNESKEVESNTNKLIPIIEGPEEEKAEAKNNYAYYMVIDYDKNGDINIRDLHGADFERIEGKFLDFQWDKTIVGDSEYKIENPKNITIIYGIPKDLKFADRISSYIDNATYEAYQDAAMPYIVIAIVIIAILALIIPYRKAKNIIGSKTIFKIPFEINVILVILVLVLMLESGNTGVMIGEGGSLISALSNMNMSRMTMDIILYLGNVLYWTVLLWVVFVEVLLLKHIFNIGLLSYFKENTIIIKGYSLVKAIIKKIYSYISDIDLRDKSNRSIIKILVFNFVILVLICSMWFFGIIGAVIYSVVLFRILKKYADDIKEKYNKLLKATNKIAEGNLDVAIDEDLGIFNPFKEEVEKIQKGFKKAVDEEVKSQNMKTELISNVSHDLKTPLTSIITYIDLLKNENITEEERKSYIDTLDRKSQRLKNLIEDLFEVSKATSKNINLSIINVDIVSLMKQTQFELSDKIEQSSLEFKWNFQEEKIVVPLDSQKTFRVFENLLMNIVKYSMPNSRVYVDIVNDEEGVYVTLKNMSANEIDFNVNDIVERFVRGDRSRNTEGYGLGLAIAKSFVELQGGDFSIETDGDLFKVIIRFNK